MNFRTGLLTYMATGLLIALFSTVAHAQRDDDNPQGVSDELLRKVLSRMSGSRPTGPKPLSAAWANPGILKVDPKTNAVTMRLVSTNDDSVQVRLTAQYAGLKNDTDTSAAGRAWSMESWVKDLPEAVTIRGHQARMVTFHITVPASLKPGEYLTHIVVATYPFPGAKGSTQSSNPIGQTAAKLMYRASGQ